MQVLVTGKQLDVGDSLRGHAEATIAAIVERYFERAIEAHVVFCRERHLILSDISVRARRGLLVQCHGEASDPGGQQAQRHQGQHDEQTGNDGQQPLPDFEEPGPDLTRPVVAHSGFHF